MELSSQILSELTIFNKYAKYIPILQRRETWDEIVTRNMDMHIKKYPQLKKEIIKNYDLVYSKKVLPSMRSLQFGGKSIEISPNRMFNCCYCPIDHYCAFSETMFLLLGGTGVGYSVQKHHVEQLPEIQKPTKQRRYLISDSIEGWADAVKALMKAYFGKGTKPNFDYSDIRPKGARLVTSGGKAPGSAPLKECLIKIEQILNRKNNGDKLSSLECHDILCFIANAVLAGGIRRAALICGFNLDDNEMINCKSSSVPSKILNKEIFTYTDKDDLKIDSTKLKLTIEQNGIVYTDVIIRADEKTNKFWDLEQYESDGTLGWWVCNEQRGRSNNSAIILRHKIKEKEFFKLWKRIEESRSGEPGIYLSNDKEYFANPCNEIALRPHQMCNLTEINGSDILSQEDLNERARVAAFIGTLQAGYTDFHYLRDIWKKTTDKDALIGVGMTGIGSGTVLNFNLQEAVEIILNENKRISQLIGINSAARNTCVKPSGTSSLVLGTSSGIHAWHSEYYIRRMRIGKNEALYTYLQIYHPELIEDEYFKPDIQAIISIPQKAPKNSILRSETAIDLLERVKIFSNDWVKPGHISGSNTHNVSATISIKDHEWDEVGKWMWKNRDVYNGLSVLPYDGGTYIQAPFEEITKEIYDKLITKLENIDLTKIIELDDTTDLKGEVACSGGACEVV